MMTLTTKNKEFLKGLAINGIIAGGVCVGLSPIFPWASSLALVLAAQTVIWNWDRWFSKGNPELEVLERDYENFRDLTDKEFEKLAKTIEEQEEVLTKYEEIFDGQLVELPCVCGGNTFKGLFAQNDENVVECEKCKNKYRVTVNYDSILIAENHNM